MNMNRTILIISSIIYRVFMLKIGMDKTDNNFRKFEYDDERMYGNPQV